MRMIPLRPRRAKHPRIALMPRKPNEFEKVRLSSDLASAHGAKSRGVRNANRAQSRHQALCRAQPGKSILHLPRWPIARRAHAACAWARRERGPAAPPSVPWLESFAGRLCSAGPLHLASGEAPP